MQWVDSLTNGQAAQVATLIERSAEFDGAAAVSEQGRLAAAGHGTALHALEVDGDDVVGYAQLQAGVDPHPDMGEVVVDPSSRRRGIGTRLVEAIFDRGRPGTSVWAHGNIDAAVEFARSRQLVGVRELLQLRRPLGAPALPEVVVPDGIIVRTYQGAADDSEILRVNGEAFAWHPEQGAWTQSDVDERTAAPWFDPAGLFLAFADDDRDRLLGFHWTKVHAADGDVPELGEVYVVGIDPAAQGRGLGRVLTLAGLHYLAARGLGSVILYVEGDNVAALHTYDRLGFDRFHVDMAYARSAEESSSATS